MKLALSSYGIISALLIALVVIHGFHHVAQIIGNHLLALTK